MYSFFQCLKYSLHIGHTIKNSNVLASWILFRIRNNIWIINIFKTVIFLKLIFKFIKYLVFYNFPFWFINLDLLKSNLFKKYSYFCGEYACVKYWIRGYLSNFKNIQLSLMSYLIKKNAVKSLVKEDLLQNWIHTRFTWPRGIFISNLDYNYICLREINQLALPIVGMVDSNIKTFLYHYPIPANDDSLESLCFILSLLSKFILLLKYKKIILWYMRFKSRIKSQKLFKLNIKKKLLKKVGVIPFFFNNIFLFKWNLNQLTQLRILKRKKNVSSLKFLKKIKKNKFLNLLLLFKLKNLKKVYNYFKFLRITRRYLKIKKKIKYNLKWIKFFDYSRRKKKKFYKKSARTFFYYFFFLYKNLYKVYEAFIDKELINMSNYMYIYQESIKKSKIVFQQYGIKWKFFYAHKLVPLIKKFTMRISKYKKGKHSFYNPPFFFKRVHNFYTHFMWKGKPFKNFSYKYYFKWFFMLLKKKSKKHKRRKIKKYLY